MNRLQETYETEIAFEYLNALDDGVGQAAFAQLGLRGHPAIVIFNAGGEEIYRSLGIVEEDVVSQTIEELITR